MNSLSIQDQVENVPHESYLFSENKIINVPHLVTETIVCELSDEGRIEKMRQVGQETFAIHEA